MFKSPPPKPRHPTLPPSIRRPGLIADSGAVPSIIETMGMHLAHPGAMEQGCALLRNFAANNRPGKALIVSEGGLSVVLEILTSGSSQVVTEQGCAAIRNIVAGTSMSCTGDACVSDGTACDAGCRHDVGV